MPFLVILANFLKIMRTSQICFKDVTLAQAEKRKSVVVVSC